MKNDLTDRRRRPWASRRRTAARTGLVVGCVVAVLVSACSTTSEDPSAAPDSAPGTAPSTEPSTSGEPSATTGVEFPEGWEPPRLEWGPCRNAPPEIECATMAVPLDWADPGGRTIDLVLGRIPATGDRIGSLVTNPGGPGGSGLEFLAGLPLTPATGRRFDTVSWDPRGVGESAVIDCDSGVSEFQTLDSSPDDPAEQAALDTAAAAISAECAADHGDLLAHVATAEVARDLEAIRRALNEGPLNYVGFSYGTRIGQEYAARFGEHIRSMALDGVVDPALGFTEFLTEQAVGFERAFDAAAAQCAAGGRAECGVDDLAASYDRVMAAAEAGTLGTTGGTFGPNDVVVAATFTGYLNDGWRRLGPALAAAEQGDGSELESLAQNYYDFGGYPAYAAVVCTDDTPPADPEQFRAFANDAAAAAPRFGAGVANEMLPCATWPVGPSSDTAPPYDPATPPIVVVGSTGDPATPFRNAQAVAARIPNAVLVTVNSDGHTAYGGTPCVDRIVDRYLIDLTVPSPGTSC
ncbi:MAG: alpha/beta fold hydrolase [Actinobacteria bacterium]|nr:alpha/beta fold hydrolase [Actinomycetota bacterium]